MGLVLMIFNEHNKALLLPSDTEPTNVGSFGGPGLCQWTCHRHPICDSPLTVYLLTDTRRDYVARCNAIL